MKEYVYCDNRTKPPHKLIVHCSRNMCVEPLNCLCISLSRVQSSHISSASELTGETLEVPSLIFRLHSVRRVCEDRGSCLVITMGEIKNRGDSKVGQAWLVIQPTYYKREQKKGKLT